MLHGAGECSLVCTRTRLSCRGVPNLVAPAAATPAQVPPADEVSPRKDTLRRL